MNHLDDRPDPPDFTHTRRLDLEGHGTRSCYRRGCRCLLCRVASARSRADYRDPRRRPHYADVAQEA